MLLQIGDLDQAMNDINQAITISPDEIAYCVRGYVHRAKGDLEKAIDDHTLANRIDARWMEVLERRAETYAQLGMTEEAQADRQLAESLKGGRYSGDDVTMFLAVLSRTRHSTQTGGE